jgi:hypothetical protein
MSNTNNELIPISVEYITSSIKAIKVTDGDITTWIPKSQIDNYDDIDWDRIDPENSAIEIDIPEWLAINKGLV